MARPPHRHKPKPPARLPDRPTLTLRAPREELHKIAGLPAVQALYAHQPDRAERLFFDDRMKEQAEPYAKLMAARRKVYRHVPTEELTRIAGSPLHGGILVVAHPKPVEAFDPAQAALWAKAGKPLLILDGVGNPHNLGAIARTMAFFGLEHLVVSGHPGQALPSEAAFRVAEGGLEWVSVHRAADLPAALQSLKAHYRVVGTALGALRPLAEVVAPGAKPLAIVLGNEEDGLPPATREACDEVATLPGAGRVQSLNVSATAAILVHLLAGSVC
jgi:TrmH RNA methyltransferase